MKKNSELIALIMGLVFSLSVFAILEMCSNGIVKQGLLAFILSIGVVIASLIGGVYFDIQTISDQSKKIDDNRWIPTIWG